MSSSTVGVGADDLVTGEAVALDLPHAGLGLRICSGIIDLVVGFAALWGLQWVAYSLAGAGDDALVGAAITIATIGAMVAIPTTFETLTRGKTLGHLALGLRTVRDDAGPISFRHAVTRAMVGVIEILPLLGTRWYSRAASRSASSAWEVGSFMTVLRSFFSDGTLHPKRPPPCS